MTIFANVPMPDARRRPRKRRAHDPEEVRALLRIIARTAAGPNGETATRADIAEMLGITASTLDSYCNKPRPRAMSWRGIPYATLYCLEVMAANPRGVANALWPQK